MPEHATGRFAAGLFDQQSEEHRVADWGGDELFTRMPRRPVVDDAPAPRFHPQLELVDAPRERRVAPAGEEWSGPRDRRRPAAERHAMTAEEAMRERAERLGIALVEPTAPPAAADEPAELHPLDAEEWTPSAHVAQYEGDGWDRSGARPMKVITGRPDAAPRARPVPARRRPQRTPAEWIGPRPERIMAWAFALGLLLILIAISTADAATL